MLKCLWFDRLHRWNLNKWQHTWCLWWEPKGGTREIASLRLQDKLSIIAAIFSDGHWVLRMSRCNINSNVFIEFVDELRKFINSKDYYKDKTILLLIDNASYHKTKPVVEKLRWISRLIIFIPPYSPQFNPIELFFAALKAKIRRLRIERALKLSTEAGRQGVVDAINQIKPSIVSLLLEYLGLQLVCKCRVFHKCWTSAFCTFAWLLLQHWDISDL